MTTIKTTCQRCGDVELTTDRITLYLIADQLDGMYCFTCPFCGREQEIAAGPRVVRILQAVGVEYEIRVTPSSISEAEISNFGRELDREGWIEGLTA